MKINKAVAVVFLFGFALIMTGCPGNNSPSSPSNGGGNNTSVLSIQSCNVEQDYAGALISYQIEVSLQLSGQPVTTAAVTVSSAGAGTTISVPYFGPVTNGTVSSRYYTTAAFTYTAGQTYVLSATASGQSASVTLAAPGGSLAALQDSNGAVTQFSDGLAGNTNQVVVRVVSPVTITYNTAFGTGTSFNIPDSGVSNAYAAPQTQYLAGFLARNLSGNFAIGQQLDVAVTVLDNVWDNPSINYNFDTSAGSTFTCSVGLNVQGTVPTSAAVTVADITAAHNVAVPYIGSYAASSGVSYAQYFYQGTGLPYTPGDSYVLSTTSTLGTASVTLAAPGGVSTAVDSTTHAVTLVSWTNPASTSNAVFLTEISPASVFTYNNSPNAVSPVTLSNSLYAGGTGSVYQAEAQLISKTSTIANGTLDPSGLLMYIAETYTQSITFN
jgi:hypothetical protein